MRIGRLEAGILVGLFAFFFLFHSLARAQESPGILLFVIVLTNGEASTGAMAFPSMKVCEDRKAGFKQFVQDYNNKNHPQIKSYGANCTEIKDAPKGPDA
jgi:hypothetical protein